MTVFTTGKYYTEPEKGPFPRQTSLVLRKGPTKRLFGKAALATNTAIYWYGNNKKSKTWKHAVLAEKKGQTGVQQNQAFCKIKRGKTTWICRIQGWNDPSYSNRQQDNIPYKRK